MKKRYFLIIISLLIVWTLLVACYQDNGASMDHDSINEEEGQVLQIIDMVGREITIQGPIDRIVAIGSALRLYTYINGTEKLVGVERGQQAVESGRPYILANPQLGQLPIVGEGHPANPDPELLLQVRPQVIIAGDIMDRAQIEHIEDTIGIPIVITSTSSGVFDQDTFQALEIIGKITGKEERAQQIVNYIEESKSQLRELTRDIAEEDKARVYVGGLSYKGSHGIESTTIRSPLLDLIHARNVADELEGQGSIMVDKEQIIKWDPDIIIIDQNGLDIVREDYRKNPEFYNMLTAVETSQLYGQLPYISYYNNIETALADVYFLGKVIFPNEFKDIDPQDKADEIYNFFLGKPLYNTMADKYGGYGKIQL